MAKFNITISPTLKDLPHFPLSDLVEFQGELKDLDAKRYNRLKKSIKDKGLFIPFFVWQCEADNVIYILDGHQRKRVLSKEGFTGNVPCVVIEADNEKDAKERLLVISSQYGKITQEGFDAFTYDLDPLFIQETTFFDGLPFVYGDYPEQGEKIDPAAEWENMPEFENDDAMGIKTLKVHFQTEDDLREFANLVEQPVNMNTRYIWYPKQEDLNLKNFIASNES